MRHTVSWEADLGTIYENWGAAPENWVQLSQTWPTLALAEQHAEELRAGELHRRIRSVRITPCAE